MSLILFEIRQTWVKYHDTWYKPKIKVFKEQNKMQKIGNREPDLLEMGKDQRKYRGEGNRKELNVIHLCNNSPGIQQAMQTHIGKKKALLIDWAWVSSVRIPISSPYSQESSNHSTTGNRLADWSRTKCLHHGLRICRSTKHRLPKIMYASSGTCYPRQGELFFSQK